MGISLTGWAQNAEDIIRKADEKYRGKLTAYSEMAITVVRPKWKRTMKMKSWSKGEDYSLILMTSPAKEKGIVFLKRIKEVWNWVPSIERTIKLPPSVMMQSWMGTDFTNDDLVKESSTINDYTHSILPDSTILDRKCWKIQLIPKPEAPVVWGRVILYIDQVDFIQLRGEFYDEDGYLINLMKADEIKELGGQLVASRWEMIPVEKKGHKTIMEFINIQFDAPINDRFFTTYNMKKVQ
jgi:outer membrane lipoprotein-sorting protein